jgi:hypothetical protein
MSRQESELAAGPGGEAAAVTRGSVVGGAVDQAADVAVSEAGRCELATGDGIEQGKVGRIIQAQGAEAAMALEDGARARDGVEEFCARRGVLHGGEGFKVRVVGTLGDLSTSMEIRDTLAKRPPFELGLGVVMGWTEDLEVLGPRDGGLDAKDATGLVGLLPFESRVESSELREAPQLSALDSQLQ